MSILADLISLLIKALIAYAKAFKFNGILILILVVEVISLLVYRDWQFDDLVFSSSPIQVEEVRAGGTSEKEEYRFYLDLQNDGAENAYISSICLKTDNGSEISEVPCGLYNDLEDWAFLSEGSWIPPGSTSTVEIYVPKEVLQNVDTEKIIFSASYDGKEGSIPMSEIGL